IVGDIGGDDGARRDIGAVADLDRRNQRGIGADKGTGADLGPVLGEAVVIAGDGAGADIGASTHARVSNVGEVVGLGLVAELRGLGLDEVADAYAAAEFRSGTKPRER